MKNVYDLLALKIQSPSVSVESPIFNLQEVRGDDLLHLYYAVVVGTMLKWEFIYVRGGCGILNYAVLFYRL